MLQKLKKDHDALQAQLETAKRQLEAETVQRVDVQNRIQSLKEELDFKANIHAQVRTVVRYTPSEQCAHAWRMVRVWCLLLLHAWGVSNSSRGATVLTAKFMYKHCVFAKACNTVRLLAYESIGLHYGHVVPCMWCSCLLAQL